MKKSLSKTLDGLKLNIKFTLVIVFLLIVPISVLAGILFYYMERNVVSENLNHMQYTMERTEDNIYKNIDSINMTTQFFLSDTSLLGVLNDSVGGEELTTEELLEFYNKDIASLERLVNNNPILYGVRVYAVNDNVQEMMPILFRHSRMEKMEWAKKEDFEGWNYNYEDCLFEGRKGNDRIASLVTCVESYENGCIGVVETAVAMENLFPVLYQNVENEMSFIVADDGSIYSGITSEEEAQRYVEMYREANENAQTFYLKTGGEHFIFSYLYIKEMEGAILSVENITANVQYVYRMRDIFVTFMLIIVIGIAVLINFIVKRLLRHFYEILKSIRTIQNGDLSVRVPSGGSDEMGELGTQINKMLDRIEQLMKENIDRELLMKNSEIRALQNQINAHFIYNVLESIKMMAEIDEEYAISNAITSLGKLLRYGMHWVSGNVLVENEIEYIRDYLALINLRFDYEIYLSLNLPEEILKQEIPKMTLQPIVENAICHGIEELAEDTNIYIKGTVEGSDCIIEITDPGQGMNEEQVEKLKKKIAGEIETSGGSGNGIGLKNVQDRIRISFGEGYGVGVASKLGCYTKITVRIPMTTVKEGQ